MSLEDAARALVALWDEQCHASPMDDSVDERAHELLLDVADYIKRPGWGNELADAIARLEEALP